MVFFGAEFAYFWTVTDAFCPIFALFRADGYGLRRAESADANPHSDRHDYTDGYAHPYPNAKADGYFHTNTDGDGYANPNTDSDGYAHADSYADTNRCANGNPHAGAILRLYL